MGRSASRLSSTRSGVVSSGCLAARIAGLPFAAPIPPLALFGRQAPVARLGHGRAENIQTTDVLLLPGRPAKFFIELLGVLFRELRHALNSEKVKITEHGRTDRDQFAQLPCLGHHENPP